MELLVQFVESSFYIWVILALKDYNTLTKNNDILIGYYNSQQC